MTLTFNRDLDLAILIPGAPPTADLPARPGGRGVHPLRTLPITGRTGERGTHTNSFNFTPVAMATGLKQKLLINHVKALFKAEYTGYGTLWFRINSLIAVI